MNECVMCGQQILDECGSMVCPQCIRDATIPKIATSAIEFPKNNVELSFNGGNLEMDFIIGYRRAKSLNRFQIWMFKVCFGIRAKNI